MALGLELTQFVPCTLISCVVRQDRHQVVRDCVCFSGGPVHTRTCSVCSSQLQLRRRKRRVTPSSGGLGLVIDIFGMPPTVRVVGLCSNVGLRGQRQEEGWDWAIGQWNDGWKKLKGKKGKKELCQGLVEAWSKPGSVAWRLAACKSHAKSLGPRDNNQALPCCKWCSCFFTV